jgi:hypothetical protein
MTLRAMLWKIPGPIIGAGLSLVGAAGLWWCPDALGIRFSEAFLIAGILSLTVDLYLKRKLQEDAARDIFHHLLGVNLPADLKDKLQNFFFENRSYRKNVIIEAHGEKVSDGILFSISVSSTVVATADTNYRQGLWFEESENPQLLQVSMTSTAKASASYSLLNPPLVRKQDVLEWRGKKIPMNRDDELTTYAKFTVKQQETTGFWTHNFGASTIHPRVRISAGEGLKVTASIADQVNGNEHIYKKVFLAGDHVQIRWKFV